jgi:hypothetical protein
MFCVSDTFLLKLVGDLRHKTAKAEDFAERHLDGRFFQFCPAGARIGRFFSVLARNPISRIPKRIPEFRPPALLLFTAVTLL